MLPINNFSTTSNICFKGKVIQLNQYSDKILSERLEPLTNSEIPKDINEYFKHLEQSLLDAAIRRLTMKDNVIKGGKS